MRDFFKPWRRKAGYVTLVMAAVCLAGWNRSFVIADHVKLQRGSDGRTCSQITSSLGNLDWERVQPDDSKGMPPLVFSRYASAFLCIANSDGQRTILWKWNRYGIGQGECHSESFEKIRRSNPGESLEAFRFTIWRLSYWYAISPLTLLSAYLLLNKPRPAKKPAPFPPPEADHA